MPQNFWGWTDIQALGRNGSDAAAVHDYRSGRFRQ